MSVITGIGAYQQADLERMDDQELREVRDWAGQEFNRHLRSHGDSDESCEACEYLEILQGAASDLLLDRHREGSGGAGRWRAPAALPGPPWGPWRARGGALRASR